MTNADLASLSVRDALARFADDDPVPGGGAASAVGGALGASLVAMLARTTLGKKAYASYEKLMQAVAEEADAARERLLALAAEDAGAYTAVVEAYRMPHETDDEKRARDARIQEAFRGAIAVPLRIMEACVEVIGLAKNAIEAGNKNAASDGATGAEMARAGLRSAAASVRANLVHVHDEAYAREMRTRLDEMLYMGTKVCTNLDSFVNDLWDAAG